MICMLELKPQVEYFRYLDYDTVHNAFFKFWLIALFNAPSKLKCRKCSWCINHAQWSANFISYYWEREKTVDYSCCGLWWQWWLLTLLCASTDMLEVLVEGTRQMWSFRVRKVIVSYLYVCWKCWNSNWLQIFWEFVIYIPQMQPH